MTKAGGVGGLLMASISGTNCFIAYDGNGNITALINAADKSLAARYEYSPYGELLRETGLLAHQNPFRFSTKYWDDESGLVYYNFRFYSPALGKWIGRDPTTDQIYLNLYLFCHNNPINRFDTDGRIEELDVEAATGLGEYIDAAMCGAIINGTLSMVTSQLENAYLGGHNNVWSDFASGCAVGAFLGPGATGTKLIEKTAINILGKETAGKYAAAGITAVLMTYMQANVKAIWGDDEQLNKLEKNPLGQAGIALGIGLAAQFIGGVTCADPDGIILNAVLNIGGDKGVDAEENIWGIAENVN